ncbi:hypothetical protein HF086_007090 [Spodoptera exigua]|uniref:Uncharacterized protein n=1 Tax=Spodoptera exigua TaxID=7107 RepID=A0A922SGK1_SPOEX|nr:hypothetical protein HF086_007090 [Spodoptera exigua]
MHHWKGNQEGYKRVVVELVVPRQINDFSLGTGGPGSGKVTHCDNLMQERRGVVHINMTDLLQQYAIGNGTTLPGLHFM